MPSVVSICNMALDRIGHAEPIGDLTDDSAGATVCARWYQLCRDEVLRAHRWGFARRTQVLALVEEDPDDEWGYSYRYPADCVLARRFVSALGDSDPNEQPFDISSDESGRLILCDVEDAELVYTARIEDPALFPEDFAAALAWKLAAEIAIPLARSIDVATNAAAQYRQALPRAIAANRNEQRGRPPTSGAFIVRRR